MRCGKGMGGGRDVLPGDSGGWRREALDKACKTQCPDLNLSHIYVVYGSKRAEKKKTTNMEGWVDIQNTLK